ncbi:MAG: hypothetical protein E6R14_10290 [Thermomicrobiales bacterium]|nr:MAG: hypothetical protein E6R14_10290 [Thermomicrobiales bacterium]
MMSSRYVFALAACVLITLAGCSEKTTVTTKLADEVASVGVQVKSGQRQLKVGEKLMLPLSVVNNGKGVIPAMGNPDGSMQVFATYHWLREGGDNVVWDGIRTALPQDIGAGKAIDLSLAVQAPAKSGRFILVIDLVQEGALWFADTGSQTARLAFNVTN